MSNQKKYLIWGVAAIALLGTGSLITLKLTKPSGKASSTDAAFLALIKNDEIAFMEFLEGGGNLHDGLPEIEGKHYSVAEGLSHFVRPNFVKLIQERKMKFIRQDKSRAFDIVSLAIPANNAELLSLFMKEAPDMKHLYGANQYSLLHLASISCSSKLIPILHEQGKLNWDLKAKDGSTPLTLAAQHDCLPALGYWKDKGANFNDKDGQGNSALSILRKKKDAALTAFAQSFEARVIASLKVAAVKEEPNFYKKRKIPKDQLVDERTIIEPNERPIEAVETAEFSEFAD